MESKYQYDSDGKVLRDKDGKRIVDGDISSSVKFHAGELNTKFSTDTDGSTYYHARVELVEPKQVPNSTLFAINESRPFPNPAFFVAIVMPPYSLLLLLTNDNFLLLQILYHTY